MTPPAPIATRQASLPIRPLTQAFGVDVTTLDLSAANDDELRLLRGLLTEHALLLLRRQSLHDADLVRLAKALGKVAVASKRSSHAPDHPEVMYVSNLKDEDNRIIGGLDKRDHSESVWHSDQSFRVRPATLSTLFCVHPAAEGGGTGFISTVQAWAALAPALRERVAELQGLYRPRPSHEIEIVEVAHRVRLVNPHTGREALYVSELCHGFEGMGEDQGQALLDQLLTHLRKPEFRYTHDWRMGDMLIYDNAQLLHRREAFSGMRWLKATRSFAPDDLFAVID